MFSACVVLLIEPRVAPCMLRFERIGSRICVYDIRLLYLKSLRADRVLYVSDPSRLRALDPFRVFIRALNVVAIASTTVAFIVTSRTNKQNKNTTRKHSTLTNNKKNRQRRNFENEFELNKS